MEPTSPLQKDRSGSEGGRPPTPEVDSRTSSLGVYSLRSLNSRCSETGPDLQEYCKQVNGEICAHVVMMLVHKVCSMLRYRDIKYHEVPLIILAWQTGTWLVLAVGV